MGPVSILRVPSMHRAGHTAGPPPGDPPRTASPAALRQDQGVHDRLHGKRAWGEELAATGLGGGRGAREADDLSGRPSPSWSSWSAGVPRCWSSVPAASSVAGGDTGAARRPGGGGQLCSSRQVGRGPGAHDLHSRPAGGPRSGRLCSCTWSYGIPVSLETLLLESPQTKADCVPASRC